MLNRTRLITKSLLSVGLALVLSLQITVPSIAAGESDSPGNGKSSAGERVRPGLQPCVDMALQMKLQQWVCNAEGLTINKDAAGQHSEKFIAMKSTDYYANRPASGSVSLLAADDYDSWCEFGTMCHRNISSYISETKGNAAYGNEYGVIGNYDAILRTNLNGRSAQWRAVGIWDNGPQLYFSSTQVQCIENTAFPIVCGNHGLPNVTLTTYSPTWRYDYSTVYGNYLSNSNYYHGAFQTLFTPTGYPTYRAANLATLSFNCPGTQNCYF